MGAVYEVTHLGTRRRRALKVMLPSLVSDSEMRARFALEATVTADVDSEHIVDTFDAGVDEETGAPFLVMELLKGEDLGRALEGHGPFAFDEAIVLLRQAARALDRTHAAGIVHRDLKPENMFVTTRDDGSPRLKILDFGIAKVVAQSSQSLKTTRSVGTPVYMSPEQIEGDGAIGPAADVYALAHIAYTLLVGEAYWDTEANASETVFPLLVKIMQGAKEPARARAAKKGVTLPEGFDAFFSKATARAPGERFASAGDLVRALEDVLGVANERVSAPVSATRPRVEHGEHVQARSGHATVDGTVSLPIARASGRVWFGGLAAFAAICCLFFVARASSRAPASSPPLAPSLPAATSSEPIATSPPPRGEPVITPAPPSSAAPGAAPSPSVAGSTSKAIAKPALKPRTVAPRDPTDVRE